EGPGRPATTQYHHSVAFSQQRSKLVSQWASAISIARSRCMSSAWCAISRHQFDHDAATDHRRRPLQTTKRNVVLRIKQTVNLGAARLEQRGHLVLGDFLFLHGLGKLRRDDLLDSLRLCLFEDALLLEEVINARTHM